MKRIVFCLAVLLIASGWLFLAPKAAITVRVVDEAGAPIAGVPVRLGTYSHTAPGMEFGQDIWDGPTISSDTNGVAAFVVRSKLQTVEYDVYPEPPGYYNDYGGEYRFDEESGGRWLPWNPTVELVLKRITDPVPMYVRWFGSDRREVIPVKAQEAGFDLMKSDWLPPYGKGEVADFVFRLDVEDIPVEPGYYEKNPFAYRLHRSKFTVTFSNEGDGIQSFPVKLRTGSALPSPTRAPTDGYRPRMEWIDNLLTQQHEEKDIQDETMNYLFRVRSEMEDGKVVRACYGKIYGRIGWHWQGSLQFLYYLNPDTTSRSLEFDTKRNLYTPEEGETYSPGP